MKINISLDDKLVNRIDEYADYNYMSRSGLISLACTQYLNSRDMIVAMQKMSLAFEKIANDGLVDDDTQKQLNDIQKVFEYLCKGQQ